MSQQYSQVQSVEAAQRAEASRTATKAADMVQQLQQGNIPNAQELGLGIDMAKQQLQQVQRHPEMGEAGRSSAQHVEKALEATQQLVQETGLQEKLQTIVTETKLAQEEAASKLPSAQTVKGENKEALDQMKDHATRMAQSLQPIVKLIVSSSEFREILNDLVTVSHCFLTDATNEASNVAQKAMDEGLNKAKDQVKEDVERGKDAARNISEGQKPGVNAQAEQKADRIQELAARLVNRAGNNPAFKDGINHLMELLSIAYSQLQSNAKLAKEKAKEVAGSTQVKAHSEKALTATKELIAEFTGEEALDGFLNGLYRFMNKIASDEQLKEGAQQWWSQGRAFIRQALDNPKSISEEQFKRNLTQLRQDGDELLTTYSNDPDFQEAVNQAFAMMDNLKDDELLNQWNNSMKRVMDDLFIRGNSGELKLNTATIDQWRRTVSASIASNLKFIGVPRTEYHDETYDAVMDNMAIAVKPILPAQITISAGTEQHLNMREWDYMGSKTVIVVRIKGIQLDMKDAKFSLNRKTFPSITDNGTVDITTGGKGLSILLAFLQTQGENEKYPTFRAPRTLGGGTGGVEVSIDKLNVHVHDDANHQTLLNFVTSIASGRIRRNAQQAIHDGLANAVTQVADELNRFVRSQY